MAPPTAATRRREAAARRQRERRRRLAHDCPTRTCRHCPGAGCDRIDAVPPYAPSLAASLPRGIPAIPPARRTAPAAAPTGSLPFPDAQPATAPGPPAEERRLAEARARLALEVERVQAAAVRREALALEAKRKEEAERAALRAELRARLGACAATPPAEAPPARPAAPMAAAIRAAPEAAPPAAPGPMEIFAAFGDLLKALDVGGAKAIAKKARLAKTTPATWMMFLLDKIQQRYEPAHGCFSGDPVALAIHAGRKGWDVTDAARAYFGEVMARRAAGAYERLTPADVAGELMRRKDRRRGAG